MRPGDHLVGDKQGTLLSLRVTPRASKNELVGVMSDGTVKVRLTAPPLEGKANAALLKFLAKILDIPISRLEIVSGSSAREKLISVSGMDESVLRTKIMHNLC
jgi:uncharacterized protein (TIGR00251 family)